MRRSTVIFGALILSGLFYIAELWGQRPVETVKYWDSVQGSPYYCVAREIDRRHETRFDDTLSYYRMRSVITGIVIVAPDTMWAYSETSQGSVLDYFHEPACLEGDTINFSVLDPGVSMQDAYWQPETQRNWVVPIGAIRPRGGR